MTIATNLESQIGRRSADGRPLADVEKLYFSCRTAFLGGVIVLRKNRLGSDRKMKDAFRQVVKKSPLLQTQILGKPSLTDDLVFERVAEEDWPMLKLESETYTIEEHALERGRDIVGRMFNAYQAGENNIHSGPLSVVAIKGKKTVVLAWVASHYFLDGVGVAAVIMKFMLYSFFPRRLWPALDRKSSQAVPTLKEMVLKDMYSKVPTELPNEYLNEFYGEDFFRFSDYSPQTIRPGEASRLRGFTNEVLGTVTSKEMAQCRSKLRAAGVTLTTAMTALALKVFAAIVYESYFGSNGDDSPETPLSDRGPLQVVATTPMDARKIGQWGDERDKKNHFPEVANYAFGCFTPIPLQEVVDESLEEIALRIKTDVNNVRSNASDRWQSYLDTNILATRHPYLCGVSSIVSPKMAERVGLTPLHASGAGRLQTSLALG